jgi:hypothetical protein
MCYLPSFIATSVSKLVTEGAAKIDVNNYSWANRKYPVI